MIITAAKVRKVELSTLPLVQHTWAMTVDIVQSKQRQVNTRFFCVFSEVFRVFCIFGACCHRTKLKKKDFLFKIAACKIMTFGSNIEMNPTSFFFHKLFKNFKSTFWELCAVGILKNKRSH